MTNLNVAVLGAQGYVADIGKKGTSSDITFYNLKKDEDTITFIEPSKYPERLASLFYAVSTAGSALLVVDELTPVFGESAIMLHCCGIERGFIVLRNSLTEEKVAPLLRGTLLERYEFMPDDKVLLRERLLDEVRSSAPAEASPSGFTVVDHSFNVKGVGTVALGTVMGGTVRRHDEVKVLPGDRTAQIRSIQKHDDDFDSASKGDRVGLALKNIGADELPRGSLITNDPLVRVSATIDSRAEMSRYWPSPIKEGAALHLGYSMQFVPAKVESAEGEGRDWRNPSLKLTLEKPLAHPPCARATIMCLGGCKLRVVGTIALEHAAP